MDTLRLVINPRSIPNITVPARGCANDSIQFLDASYTDEPFEDYEIILQDFLNEAIEVLKLGTGMPAFNNDEVINQVNSLIRVQ